MNDTPGHIEPAQTAAVAMQSGEATESQASEPIWYSLDPAYIRAEQVGGLIFFGVVFVGAIIGLFIKFLFGGFDWIWIALAGGCGLLLILLLWAAIIWPGMEYRRICWRLTAVGLEIRQGVWWRHQISVPIARLQHADVSQGPLQRSFGLGTLTVHTAGSQNATVDIGGLNHGVALELRDRLIRQRSGRGNSRTSDPATAQPPAELNFPVPESPVPEQNADD
ncbi:MAG: PH domain-containing protein [Pirellulaceae bacterium]